MMENNKNGTVIAQLVKDEQNAGVHVFKSKKELKDFVSGISSTTLKQKKYFYYFILNKTAKDWFEELYKPEFFNIDEELRVITLNPLPNGIRRTRVYSKKVDVNKTFQNSLERIKKSIEPRLSQLDYAFEIKNEIYLNQPDHDHLEKITIFLQDLRDPNPSDNVYGSKIRSFVLLFDKKTWEYEFTFIVVPRELKEVEKIVRWGFEKHTSSTRNYRAKNEVRT